MISTISGQSFDIRPEAKEILNKLGYPEPQTTYIESHQRKLAYRNHFHLFRRNCDLTGKSILSIIPPFMPFKVYEKSAWFGDSWDALSYGRDYDFNRGFFSQFYELQKEVPIFNLQNVNSENSEYCSSVSEVKDCYLAFAAYGKSQDIYYSYNSISCRDLYYCNFSYNLENSFYCYNCKNGCNNIACEYCQSCSDCWFSYSLESCNDCIFCSNLKRKQYCIFNKQYSKTEYFNLKKTIDLSGNLELKKHYQTFKQLKLEAVTRACYLLGCEDCIGNELANCRNCSFCFNANDSESLHDCLAGTKAISCFRCYGLVGNEFCYETCGTLNAVDSSFLNYGYSVYDCHYSMNLHSCKHCFGCVGLRNQSYCIFNKQYSKNDYEILKSKIIKKMQDTDYVDSSFSSTSKEWGNTFPAKFSYVPYNNSLAMMHWRLTKNEALSKGFIWHDENAESVQARMIYKAPDNILKWDENMENKVIICEISGKSFNILPKVIGKFKAENLSIILEHPIENILRRCSESKYEMLHRVSSKSNKAILSTFDQESHPLIFSDTEYTQEFS